ncbi:MAG TPA: hypothetical protein VKP64_14260, partial [Mycobacteriales bacterium]|nr:hypothetical protein [Mycobacteriales bacterium]
MEENADDGESLCSRWSAARALALRSSGAVTSVGDAVGLDVLPDPLVALSSGEKPGEVPPGFDGHPRLGSETGGIPSFDRFGQEATMPKVMTPEEREAFLAGVHV